MKKLLAVLAIVTTLSFGLTLDAHAQGAVLPIGADVTLRNTLQDPGEAETPFPSLFGLPADAYDERGTVSASAAEFPTALAQPGTPVGDISGLYEINLSADSLSFRMLPQADDPFWKNVFGDFPAGKFDRYYLTFSQPHNVNGFTSTNGSVALRVDSPTVLVVEISEGYQMSPPRSFRIDLTSNGTPSQPQLAVTGTETGVLAVIGASMVIGGALIVARTRRFA